MTEEQSRLRSNLQALGANLPKEQESRVKWVTALATNEDQLTERRAKLDDAGGKLHHMDETLAKEVRDYKDE